MGASTHPTLAASPYAAQAIGATFSEHGSLPNGWAWLLSHGALGALNAKVNGGNAVSGAVSAAAAEAVVSAAAKELFGDKALVNGKLDVSRLTQEDKEKLSTVGALVGAASGYAVGGNTANAQLGGVVAKNAVENNRLAPSRGRGVELIIIPAFGALYCSIDKQCTDPAGTFVGMLNDLLEQDAKIEAENQKQLEEMKAKFGTPWILSSNNSNEEKNSTANQSQNNSTVQAATGSPQIEPPESKNNHDPIYEEAKNGGRHAGFYRQHVNLSQKELERGISSLNRQIDTHQKLIRNPEKMFKELNKGDWKSLDPRQQNAFS